MLRIELIAQDKAERGCGMGVHAAEGFHVGSRYVIIVKLLYRTTPSAMELTMPGPAHFYEPRDGHGLPHDPFNAIVGPHPIGWISSRSQAGVLNLAPCSFFNAFNYTPSIVGFASIGYKHTLRNIEPGHAAAGRGDEPELRAGAARHQ